MGKSISKAFKKVTNNALGTLGLGSSGSAPAVNVPAPAAAPAEVPQQEDAQVEEQDTTQADQRKGRRRGKGGLSISRTSGGGISI